MKVKWLIVVIGSFAALAAPNSAHSATTVSTITFDETFPLCNGDLFHATATLRATMSETTTPSGGEVIAYHYSPQGGTGIDLVTGDLFRGGGVSRDLIVNSPRGGTTETFVLRFHFQGTGGLQSFIINDLFHVTVAPDGAVRVSFDNFSASC